jgi:hypothetical protein
MYTQGLTLWLLGVSRGDESVVSRDGGRPSTAFRTSGPRCDEFGRPNTPLARSRWTTAQVRNSYTAMQRYLAGECYHDRSARKRAVFLD